MLGIIENFAWLAINIWMEAGNQPFNGKVAVGHITLNRVQENKSSIKEVVLKKKQFSWTFQSQKREINLIEIDAMIDSVKAAHKSIVEQLNGNNLSGANHYFNPSLASPSWAKDMEVIATIADHRFLKG